MQPRTTFRHYRDIVPDAAANIRPDAAVSAALRLLPWAVAHPAPTYAIDLPYLSRRNAESPPAYTLRLFAYSASVLERLADRISASVPVSDWVRVTPVRPVEATLAWAVLRRVPKHEAAILPDGQSALLRLKAPSGEASSVYVRRESLASGAVQPPGMVDCYGLSHRAWLTPLPDIERTDVMADAEPSPSRPIPTGPDEVLLPGAAPSGENLRNKQEKHNG